MNLQEFTKEIGLPKEGQVCIADYAMTEEVYRQWKNMFYENEARFFADIEGMPCKEQLILYLYAKFAVDLYPSYKNAGISDRIYFDTFSDFTIWFSHFIKKNRVVCLREEAWLNLHLKMKLFRLGRLQFEKDEMNHSIHVHIPEGKSLNPEACDISLRQAKTFFDGAYTVFDCESWLLSPFLSELLDENSNIIQFQKRFHIIRVNKDIRQAEERVFGEVLEDKHLYTEKTTLQKNLKRYLLNGNNPGIGYGVLI